MSGRLLMYLCLIFVVNLRVNSENVGWKGYLAENPTEFHDIPLVWENEDLVPDWLSGTYVRNGPAQISFKSEKRHLASWLEGFAKLHSFKFSGSKVLYSGKMLESPNYLASVERGELVPQTTLNAFQNPDDEWTMLERAELMVKLMAGTDFDNNNPALWRLGGHKDGMYVAVTDSKVATRFNISDLSTTEMLYPPSLPITLSGCAHWMKEPGTENSIYFNYKKSLTGSQWLDVVRYRPGDSYQSPQTIVEMPLEKFSYIHSFSITEKYIVFMFYPVVLVPTKVAEANFHALELLDGSNKTDTTDIFVISLKDGEVKGPFPTPWSYSVHHINAYESSEDEIVLDLCPTQFDNLRDYLVMENMMNPPPPGSKGAETSTMLDDEITRYLINTKTGKVETSKFPNMLNNKFTNKFDFPTINEDYRGKEYCYAYGVSACGYSRTALVKKNVCNSEEDKVRYIEDHYVSEMSFIPSPGGEREDDGVLITITFDGTREQSYISLMDARDFSVISNVYLPHNIPWSAHGMYFPEANDHNEVSNRKEEL